MNDIQIFNSPQFGEIRTSGTSEEPLFCAADLCRALGHSNSRKAVRDLCDEEDVTTGYISKPIISHGADTGKTRQARAQVLWYEKKFTSLLNTLDIKQ